MFLRSWRIRLGEHRFQTDPSNVERSADGGVVYYRYTHRGHLSDILAPTGGLYARLPVVGGEQSPEFEGRYITEGLLEPLPRWLGASPYFGDLGLDMLRKVAGDVLLRIELPVGFPGLYVADFAHTLECAHLQRHGRSALGLGYDCRNGVEATTAYLHSYVPIEDYEGGHVAPVVTIVRRGQGIAVPSHFVSIATAQPLAAGWSP
ncbi:MAG: hypothetical protein NVS9B11_11840 [Candidatus Dormibacteraceae bacterium]